jgi:hypothetical protein
MACAFPYQSAPVPNAPNEECLSSKLHIIFARKAELGNPLIPEQQGYHLFQSTVGRVFEAHHLPNDLLAYLGDAGASVGRIQGKIEEDVARPAIAYLA